MRFFSYEAGASYGEKISGPAFQLRIKPQYLGEIQIMLDKNNVSYEMRVWKAEFHYALLQFALDMAPVVLELMLIFYKWKKNKTQSEGKIDNSISSNDSNLEYVCNTIIHNGDVNYGDVYYGDVKIIEIDFSKEEDVEKAIQAIKKIMNDEKKDIWDGDDFGAV